MELTQTQTKLVRIPNPWMDTREANEFEASLRIQIGNALKEETRCLATSTAFAYSS